VSDINGGVSPNPNGSPIQPGTVFTGPLLAGGVIHSDVTGNLAGLGGTTGTANAGYVVMSQSAVITQAASTGQSAGVYQTDIVIPAQSQITAIKLMVTTAFSGTATTLGIGSTASATALTAANAVVTSGALGQVTATPGTSLTQIAVWDNTGNTDIRILVTSTNTGTGVATLTVSYHQGINLAS
jgi:hypothetical protein